MATFRAINDRLLEREVTQTQPVNQRVWHPYTYYRQSTTFSLARTLAERATEDGLFVRSTTMDGRFRKITYTDAEGVRTRAAVRERKGLKDLIDGIPFPVPWNRMMEVLDYAKCPRIYQEEVIQQPAMTETREYYRMVEWVPCRILYYGYTVNVTVETQLSPNIRADVRTYYSPTPDARTPYIQVIRPENFAPNSHNAEFLNGSDRETITGMCETQYCAWKREEHIRTVNGEVTRTGLGGSPLHPPVFLSDMGTRASVPPVQDAHRYLPMDRWNQTEASNGTLHAVLEARRKVMDELHQDLVAKIWHPERCQRMMAIYGEEWMESY